MGRKIYIRAGGLCNPTGMVSALGLTGVDMEEGYINRYRRDKEPKISHSVLLEIIRVSFVAMSTMQDVEVLVEFIQRCFSEGKN